MKVGEAFHGPGGTAYMTVRHWQWLRAKLGVASLDGGQSRIRLEANPGHDFKFEAVAGLPDVGKTPTFSNRRWSWIVPTSKVEAAVQAITGVVEHDRTDPVVRAACHKARAALKN